MKSGTKLSVRISSLDEDGAGVALHTTMQGEVEVHVTGALPGEDATVVVEHVSPHRHRDPGASGARISAWGHVRSLKNVSPDRVTPMCKGYGLCGGCPVQHLAMPAQLEWKTARLRAALAGYPALAGVTVSECTPSPVVVEYRNQSKLVYGTTRDGHPRLGAYAPRSHDVIDLAGCRLVEPALEAVADTLRKTCSRLDLQPFEDLRHVGLRANAGGQVLVTLVCLSPGGRAVELVEPLRTTHPEVVGILCNINSAEGDAIFGDDERILWGSDTLEDEIDGERFLLSSRTFFQANRHVAALVYRAIADDARARGPHAVALDVYSGQGPIARQLARTADQVIAIESNPAARIESGHASESDANKIRFLNRDAALGLAEVKAADYGVVNPPRSGCSADALSELVRIKPGALAYLSCSPRTLARDLDILVGAGFRVDHVTPYDMLPHTTHIEALAFLSGPNPD